MTQEEISHIEIAQEEKLPEKIQEKKNVLWSKLSDLAGWKKDAKKVFYLLIVLTILMGGYVGIKKLSSLGAVRLHAPIELVSYQKYSQDNPIFSFVFSKKFVLDKDEQKKFGTDYLAGFHLEADQRTGCDVRRSDVGINFAKSDQEINDAISKDLGAHVKGFSNYNGKRIKMDGQPAMVTEFTLTDPLNNTLRLKQVMVSKEGVDYLLVCGSGQPQYEFYTADFSDFINSFRFTR